MDRLRCLTADANEKGCAVRYVWAVGEGLTYGCGDPKGAAGAGCGGRGVSFNLSSSPRCCCHAPPRPPPPRAHDRTAPRPRSARQARAPSTPALPRAPRAPSPAGTCRHRRCRRRRHRRRHLQPATAPPRAPSARAAGGAKPYSDWLRAGQPSLEAADIGGHEADEQPLKPITEGWRRDYWERLWGPPGGPAGLEVLGGEGPEAGEDWSRGGRRAALMANGWGSRAGLRKNLRDWC